MAQILLLKLPDFPTRPPYTLTSHSTIRKFKRDTSNKATLPFGGPRAGRALLPVLATLERLIDIVQPMTRSDVNSH